MKGASHALRALSALHLYSEILRTGKCCIEDSGQEFAGNLKRQAELRYGQALQFLGADLANFDTSRNDNILAVSILLFLFNTTQEACIA
jgi:hypothetical protein